MRECKPVDGASERAGPPPGKTALTLENGSRVAVIGGGPAGSFFCYFLLEMAQLVDVELEVDLFESRDFSCPGPAGCNMCGGIISEPLVQALAVEGINLPETVVERGIDAYVLHMPEGMARIATPLQEKRIAAIHRGAGPHGMKETRWRSFDGYLLDLAVGKGARLCRGRVQTIQWNGDRPQIALRDEPPRTYDLLVAAVGVNSPTLKLLADLALGYQPPQTTKTYICEFLLGGDAVERCLGNAMHVFLLDMPRIEFAALIPKGDYVTVCLLGEDIDGPLVEEFLATPQVRSCLPEGWEAPSVFCHCSPRISVEGARRPFADRLVFIGDCGVTRLYKDGIGAAYRTAKAAATTALFRGIAADDFRVGYERVCCALRTDNRFGKMIFWVSRMQQARRYNRIGTLRLVAREQASGNGAQRMSTIMWDMFTGSAPYREIFRRALHPGLWARLVWEVAAGRVGGAPRSNGAERAGKP